jgi:hypothetical protein
MLDPRGLGAGSCENRLLRTRRTKWPIKMGQVSA